MIRHDNRIAPHLPRLTIFGRGEGLLAARRAAQDQAVLLGHLPSDEGHEADGAGEAFCGRVPVLALERHPLLLGVDEHAARRASLNKQAR